MQELHNSKFQRIIFDEETGIMDETWKPETKNMDDEEFKNEIGHQLDATLDVKPRLVITNTLEMLYVISIEMQEWMNSVIFPQYMKVGIEKVAILLSEQIIAQLAVEQTMEEEQGSQFEFSYFSNLEEAQAWLLES